MGIDSDVQYYFSRARDESRAALRSLSPEIERAHRELADRYTVKAMRELGIEPEAGRRTRRDRAVEDA